MNYIIINIEEILLLIFFDKEHDKFKRINEGDLITDYDITLFELYNGFNFKLTLLNNTIITIKSLKGDLCNQDHLIQKLPNLGLYYINDECTIRGNLYIRFKLILIMLI